MAAPQTDQPRIIPERLAELDQFSLMRGGHESTSQEFCAMEMVAYLAGEPHSDHPQCTCPILSTFVRSWNDSLRSDEERDQLLKPLLPKLVGTRSTPAVEKARSLLALDWMIREFLPTWLEQVDSLRDRAAEVRALGVINSDEAAALAGPVVRAARDEAGAALGAAIDAALGAAYDAARDAAIDAAYGAAIGAALGAARGAARDAAYDAALGAALGAAYDAARGAARGAARDALAPTVDKLQESALDLINRMIEVPS